MPARRKPAGTRQDNRLSRRRGPAPEVREPLGNCPAHLDEAARLAWRQLAEGAPAGVLTAADRHSVELAACLLAELRRDPAGMLASRMAILSRLLAQFGCTPQGRLGLAIPLAEEPRPNPFAALDLPRR